MEEIEKLTSRGLDEYLAEEKYVQTEDLLTACVVNINCSLAGILEEMYSVRGTGKLPDLKMMANDLQIIVQHIGIMAHCLELAIPEEEEIDKFIENDVPEDTQMDAVLTTLSMMYIASNMTLEYYSSELEEENSFDWDMMNVGILDLLAQVKILCNRFKMKFVNVITLGESL